MTKFTATIVIYNTKVYSLQAPVSYFFPEVLLPVSPCPSFFCTHCPVLSLSQAIYNIILFIYILSISKLKLISLCLSLRQHRLY